MNLSNIKLILGIILLALMGIMLIILFWPLFLVLAVILLVLYLRSRKNIRVIHFGTQDLQRDLFRSQIRQKSDEEIIDVNYTENDKK